MSRSAKLGSSGNPIDEMSPGVSVASKLTKVATKSTCSPKLPSQNGRTTPESNSSFSSQYWRTDCFDPHVLRIKLAQEA
ncbi:hypothetical protein E4U43_001841 [Claviceps pusilla]|uniref:Uncharacterized protein n=1 Tax=Claviceps pusilla TaxID=123648 RepID=A0A9P7NG72_9HYPO|nr:hypothetical protein E4U43_001841 [Claviceps pusilla]